MPQSGAKPIEIDRSGRWCWLAILFVIIASVIIRGRLLSVPLERDEGEYAYIGQQMLKGVAPYASGFSMKLPGIHAVYALILEAFGQTQTGVHLGLLVANLAAIFLIFLLAKKLFNPIAGVAAAASFAIMSLAKSVMGLSANAEHFVILPVLIGVLVILGITQNRRYSLLFIAGLLMGLAFIIKQHGVFFAIFGAVYLLYFDLRNRAIAGKRIVASQVVFATGVVVPFGVTCLFFWQAGVFKEFWFWTFTYAHKYVTSMPLYLGRELFATQSKLIVNDNILIWLLALMGLLIVLLKTYFRVRAPFICGFLVFSFFTICPGYFFRGHYFILLLPVVAVLAGAGVSGLTELLFKRSSMFWRGVVITLAGLAIAGFSLFWQRAYLFCLTPTAVSRLIYDGNPFPESLEIAKYIKQNSKPDETIAVFGSEPQIYFYADRRAATRYLYVYPLMERNEYTLDFQAGMAQDVENAEPEWIVFVSIQGSWIEKPESVDRIFDWSKEYVEAFYERAGIIDMPADGHTIYRWDEQAKGYLPASDHWIGVYKRKY
jgi:4-amino-4-deoxy-L-arabinose transferase-like glycosyltransferase